VAGITNLLSKYLIPTEGPSPAQLYSEAAPRVQLVLKQYDKAAPGIDWITNNWILALGLILVGGAVASVGGNYLYDYLKKR